MSRLSTAALLLTIVAVLGAVLGGGTVVAADNVITLTASSSFPIDDVPISVIWEGDSLSTDTPICLVNGNERTPGQVEITADGRTKIWFLANVPAGESRSYEIVVGENCATVVFEWVSSDAQTTQLRYGGVGVLDYIHPVYDPANVTGTKKPFHMVYSPDGSRLITKGIGGLYTHHRGIFFGYNNISFAGASGVDVWHANAGAYPEHREIVAEWAGPVSGGHVAIIDWIHNGEVFITETRRVWAFKRSDGEIIIDFHSTLESHVGDVILDGDNHHAGVQFRAAQYVADHSGPSRFLRPEGWEHLDPFGEHAGELEMPWNAFQFVIEDDAYTVGYFTNPIVNPTGIRPREMSERRYGRFGEFIPTVLPGDGTLDFKYRFWISSRRDDITREEIQAQYVNYLIFESKPTVTGTAAPWSGQAPLTVQFTASSRTDVPDLLPGEIQNIRYEWHFGDGHSATGEQVTHTYSTEGDFTAYVIARNPFGKIAASAPIRIVVGNTAPEPQIINPPIGAVYDPKRPMRLIGTGTDPEDGDLPPESLSWEISVGEHTMASATGAAWTFNLPDDETFNWHGDVTFTVRLTATDSGGLSESIERVVRYARLQAQTADVIHGFQLTETDDVDGEVHAYARQQGAYIGFEPLDLTGREIMFIRAKSAAGALISVRTGGPDGAVIQMHPVSPGNAWELLSIPLAENDADSLYIVVEVLHEGEVAFNWLQLVGAGLPQ